MRQLVVDKAGNQEYIEFIPVNSWNSSDHIPDNLFNMGFPSSHDLTTLTLLKHRTAVSSTLKPHTNSRKT